MEIHPDDYEETAYTTGQGLWKFEIMTFGLCDAPATFERLMDIVLKRLSSRIGIPLKISINYEFAKDYAFAKEEE